MEVFLFLIIHLLEEVFHLLEEVEVTHLEEAVVIHLVIHLEIPEE
jgi:hypothetical protein